MARGLALECVRRRAAPRPAFAAGVLALEHEPADLRGRRRAYARADPRRRHIPGQYRAAFLGAAAVRLGSARPLRAVARRQSRDLWRLHRRQRPDDPLDVAGTVPAVARRSGRDAADQGHAPARGRSGGGPAPGRRTGRQRKGSRRERDDRRPAAQRSLARRAAGHRGRAGLMRARELRLGPSPGLVRDGAVAQRCRCARPAGGLFPRRFDHRRAEDPRDGDHPCARTGPARRLLRQHRPFRFRRQPRQQHRDPHAGLHRQRSLVPCRRRHHAALRSGG